jgi:hypothetical protein
MTISVEQGPVSARGFLFGADDSGAALTQALDDQGVVGSLGKVLRGLSRAGQQATARQIAAVAGGLLELDLDEMLLAGWRKHADLIAAARRSMAALGSREVVELATHTVTSTHEPYVDVYLDGAPLSRVHFELTIQFQVVALTGIVGRGRLLALAAGDCLVSAALAAEGRRLVSREGRFDLPGLVRLGAGVPLVDSAPVREPG